MKPKITLYWAKELPNNMIGIYLNAQGRGWMGRRLDKSQFNLWVKERAKIGIGVGLVKIK